MHAALSDPLTLCLILVLAVLMPAIGTWDYRRLLRQLREGRTDARLKAYVWTIGVQWTLTIGFLAWWLLADGELAALGLVPAAAGLQWLIIGLGGVVLAFILLQMVSVLRSPEKLEDMRVQCGDLMGIAPRTRTERRAFALVSITAGICEETLYRGLLTTVLAAHVGLWPAVALATAIFGVGHAYQGWTGIGKTTAAGLLLAPLAVGTGSLFIPILLHAVGDLTSGHMLHRASRGAALESTV